MSLSRKDLKELKSKMAKQNPGGLHAAKMAAKQATSKLVKQTIRKENVEKKKSVVRWNYKTNQLVTVSTTNQIGLIVSDFEYFSKRVEKNCFFVLIGNSVKQLDGKYLRLI